MRPLLALLLLAAPAAAQQHVAPTGPKSPADERASFKLPPGFEAQLVASEPDIGKPIQIAFDAAGRLWVTTSRHYPFAADPADAGTDKLYVLSDFAPDGKARKVTTFAANLNIPIGVLPLPDGKSCLVSEVGRIVKLVDDTGDGKADRKETVLGGFGAKDTHGMMNSFVLRPDGWVYACHGFANESVVTAKDGSSVKMQSGHTFRFRPDGSRVEPWTYGQVNPFGMTVDPWGNLYTADCHSKPITQLIRGAYYQSFGKPHDGLGFAPHLTEHSHGSTALCGLAWYRAPHFPKEFQDCLFLGNVVTNRINANKVTFKGAEPVATELPDFLTSSDPWFRPTDIKLGPDGALYFADFYNKIIGHYEVDLKHPGRDKDRGRVWRVVYTGNKLAEMKDLTSLSKTALFDEWMTSGNHHTTGQAELQLGLRFHASRREGGGEEQAMRRNVDAIIGEPKPANVPPLLELLETTPADQKHLRHAARIALRNTLAAGGWAKLNTDLAPKHAAIVADVALGTPGPASAGFLVTRLEAGQVEPAFCGAVARHGTAEQVSAAVGVLDRRRADAALVVRGLKALWGGLSSRGMPLPPAASALAADACGAGLTGDDAVAAAELAGSAKLAPLFEPLAQLAGRADRPEAPRAAAVAAMLAIDPARGAAALAPLLADPAAPAGLRDKLAASAGSSNSPAARAALLGVLATAPARLAATVAGALAATPEGTQALLDAVAAGKASAALLQNPAVAAKVSAAAKGKFAPRLAELTKGLPSADAKLDDLIHSRLAAYSKGGHDAAAGKAVFAKNCAACHQIGGEGAKVGPQLDGIGNRGAERVLEDVLHPNRNVDHAFRTTVVQLADGRTLSGLLLREEGRDLILADTAGKEVRVAGADVEKRTVSPLSPMPANWDAALPEREFLQLAAYLLSQRAK